MQKRKLQKRESKPASQMMKRTRRMLWAMLAVCAGASSLAGCAASGATVLGATAQETVRLVASARRMAPGSRVAVRGVAIEKCPISGCWFIVRDASGPVKVDTKAAGFTVTEMPLQTSVVVSGRVARYGSETLIEATGVRY